MPGSARRAWAVAFALAGPLACAGSPPAGDARSWNEARREDAEVLEAALGDTAVATDGALAVHLAFGAASDLDVYVTDPRLETVYFANSPIRSGGELERDLRCDGDDDAVRVETVRFASPPPGRYRVGVDYPASCEGGRGDVAYVVAVDVGGAREVTRGLARWLVFDVVAAEFEVPQERSGSRSSAAVRSRSSRRVRAASSECTAPQTLATSSTSSE